MVTKRKMSTTLVITSVIVFIAVCVILPIGAGAKSKGKQNKGMRFNADVSLTNNLASFIGKKVTVTLQSGKTFTGIVKNVGGKRLLHMEQLEGKEYYDALIRIDNITAIDARIRKGRRK
jgi:small nuclear ribonucleoprotein (snRNP)-like protein